MAKVIYGFEMDTETKRVKTFGNIRTQEAIKILQDILIAELNAVQPAHGPRFAPRPEDLEAESPKLKA